MGKKLKDLFIYTNVKLKGVFNLTGFDFENNTDAVFAVVTVKVEAATKDLFLHCAACLLCHDMSLTSACNNENDRGR